MKLILVKVDLVNSLIMHSLMVVNPSSMKILIMILVRKNYYKLTMDKLLNLVKMKKIVMEEKRIIALLKDPPLNLDMEVKKMDKAMEMEMKMETDNQGKMNPKLKVSKVEKHTVLMMIIMVKVLRAKVRMILTSFSSSLRIPTKLLKSIIMRDRQDPTRLI